jgi:glutaredoxin
MACERVKGFLSRAGVEVTVRNVDEDPSAYDELLERGWRAVPMTMIGDRVIRGFDAEALQAAIDEAGRQGQASAVSASTDPSPAQPIRES